MVGSGFASEISIDAGLSVQLPLIFRDLGFIYYCQLSPEATNDQHYRTIVCIIYIFYLQEKQFLQKRINEQTNEKYGQGH